MREAILFKGNRDGLQLIINQSVDFSYILSQLKAKLDEAAEFFAAGATIRIPAAMSFLDAQQRGQLSNLLASYGLNCLECQPEYTQEEPEEVPVPTALAIDPEQQRNETLIIPRTVRGGQRIVYGGTVIIDGDVNPGAEVVAGGNIVIMGTCRGVAHAGASGNREATITAERLLASQLRIAGMIARAPDHMDKAEYAETARITDDFIVIEPASLGGGWN